MKKTAALFAFLTLLVATPGFGQGFITRPLIGPFRAHDSNVEFDTVRTTPQIPQSMNALVQNNAIPLTMNEMVRLTLENNFTLAMNRVNPILSEYGILQTYTTWDPTLSLSASVSRNTRPSTSQIDAGAGQSSTSTLGGSYSASFSQNLKTGGSYSIRASVNRSSSNSAFSLYNPSWSGNMSYSFSQPMLRGFGVRINTAPVVIAENNLENSRIAFEQQVIDAVYNAMNRYYDLLYAAESIRVQQNALTLAQDTLEENETRVEIGTMAPVELSQSRLSVEQQRYSLLTAQNNLRLVSDDVKTMITRVADPGLVLVNLNPVDSITVPQAELMPVEEAIQLAYRTRPDMRQYELQMENAELNMMTAKNNLLPALNLNVSYNHNGQAGTQIVRGGLGGAITDVIPGGFYDLWGDMFGFNQAGYNIGFSLNIPIGNRASQIAYERQLISNRQVESQGELLRQSIATEVRNAYNQALISRQQMAIAEQSFDLAQVNLNAEERKFELGQSQLRFVIQEQNNVTAQEVAQLNARINYLKAIAAYDRSIGRTLELNNVRIEDRYRPNLAGEVPGVAGNTAASGVSNTDD